MSAKSNVTSANSHVIGMYVSFSGYGFEVYRVHPLLADFFMRRCVHSYSLLHDVFMSGVISKRVH